MKDLQTSKIDRYLFDIALAVFLTYNLLENTAWVALSPGFTFTHIFRYVKYACALLCVIVIIVNLIWKAYTKKALLMYALLGIIIALSAWRSGYHDFVWYFLLFAAAYRQDAHRVIRVTAIVTGAILLVFVSLSRLGITVDYIFNAGTRGRHGLGFGWATTAPILFLFFIMQYIFLRREKMRIWEYLILEAIAVYFFIRTDTHLAFYVSTALLVFMFVEGKIQNRWKFWKRLRILFLLLPVIVFALTMLMFVLYNRDQAFWQSINKMMHNRLTLGQNGIREYGITLLGQPISWRGYFIFATEVSDYNFIDCSYLHLLLESGILFVAATLGIYTNAMYNAEKADDYHLVFILVVILFFSVMEPRLMHLTFNVFPLMAFLKVGKDMPLDASDA